MDWLNQVGVDPSPQAGCPYPLQGRLRAIEDCREGAMGEGVSGPQGVGTARG